jgi:hypothetical protein
MTSLAAKLPAGAVVTGKARSRQPPRWRCKAASAAEGNTATTNTRFVRKHILELASYTPIVPFEVLSGKHPVCMRAMISSSCARATRAALTPGCQIGCVLPY